MVPHKINANQLAAAIGISATAVEQIIHGKRAVTPDTALRLGRFFGTTPEFWINLQTAHDLSVAQAAHGGKINRDVHPRSEG
jgi:antitoxin HigA-1